MNKKQRGLLIGFSSLLVASLSFSVVTFAWMDYHQNLDTVKIEAGSLSISNLTTDVYKYVYPFYKDAQGSDTGLIDYFTTGSVKDYTLSTTLTNVAMNVYDPTYLVISGVTLQQTAISALNTNLVFKISFDVTYSTPLNVTLSAQRNSAFVPSSTNLAISRYVNFIGLNSTTFDGLSTNYTTDADKAFYKVKTYADTLYTAASTDVKKFTATDASTSSKLAIYDGTLLATRPAQETTTTFTLYAQVEYDYALTSSGGVTNFYDATHLGNDYTLNVDYNLLLKVSQKE
jgi:hypothetical protein